MGDWVEKVKGLSSTDWQSQNSHGDIKSSMRNIIKYIVITMYDDEILGAHFVKYVPLYSESLLLVKFTVIIEIEC